MKNKKPSPGGEGSHQGASTSSVIRSWGICLRKNNECVAKRGNVGIHKCIPRRDFRI